ncbi:MAG: EAL domain-containing protein [Actinobacteria bacterium]|nr:EAL domain-containing protein [Actinomycetota bacterium]
MPQRSTSSLDQRRLSPRTIGGLWLQIALFGVTYGVLLSFEVALRVDGSWAPLAVSTGVAVGVLARVPGSRRLIFAIAQFVAGLVALILGGATIPLAAGLSMIGVCVSGVGAAVIIGLARRTLPRWDGFVGLIVAALFAASIGAGGAALAAAVVGVEAPTTAWQNAWVAFASGIIFAAPAVIMFRRSRFPVTTARLVELLCAFLGTAIILTLVLGLGGTVAAQGGGVQYLLIPIVLWFAIRFGLAVTAAVASLVDIVVITVTHNGVGPLATDAVEPFALLGIQITLTLVAIAIYSVAVNEEQRRTSAIRLTVAHGLVDSLLANSDAMISVVRYDKYGRATYLLANPLFADVLGREVEDIVGRTQDELAATPDAAQRLRSQDMAVIESDSSQVFVTRSVTGSDAEEASTVSKVYLVTKFPVADAHEEAFAVGSIALDITEHRRRERLMRLTFEESPVPMVRMHWGDGDSGRVLDANKAAADLLRVSVADLVGSSLNRFAHPDERELGLLPAHGAGAHPHRREARLVRGDGDDAWVAVTASVVDTASTEASAGTGPFDDSFALVVFEDITARRVAEQTLTHQALHDALTGVLNRYALIDRLDAALNRLWREPAYVAVLFCDLDGFKNLNDTLGHRAGDEMLIQVSQRLRQVMRPQDTVARLGGDEFVLICEDLANPGQAREVGERIREAMRRPFRIDDRDYGVTVSVGITTTTDPQGRAEDLLRRADLAMYRAKDNGRNRVEYYAEELEARAVAHVEANETLRRALDDDQILVHYQPIVDCIDGRIVGVEALARIRALDGTLVHPATFIGVAETSGLVTPMGARVLELSLSQLQAWSRAGIDIQLNVNVSPRQLARASFAPEVFEQLMKRGLAPASLCLEITEGAIVDATGPTLITLRRLRGYGVQVGIDDFGTGYSSLTTLKHVPADVLKVDRSFVEGLGEDPSDTAIVRAVIQVAHDLGCVVVGEGVESELQADALKEMGCDHIQGYRFGRPVDAEQMTEILARGNAVPQVVDISADVDSEVGI